MRRRPGFSTAEILVSVAVIAILTAVLVPAVASNIGRARVHSAQESLEAVTEAILSFREDVGTGGGTIGYPAGLGQLVAPIANPAANLCGSDYNGGQEGRWDGPYLNRAIPAAGLPIGIGTVATTFGVVAAAGGIDYLTIDVVNVVDEDAIALDGTVDDADGAAAGTVRWTIAGSGLVTVSWLLPFPDC